MKSQNLKDPQIADEATEWILRLEDTDIDPEDLYSDPAERQQHFLTWVRQSPEHIRQFLELYETYRKVGQLDPQHRIDIEELLAQTNAAIVPLFTEEDPLRPMQAVSVEAPARLRSMTKRRWVYVTGAAAAVAAIAVLSLHSFDAQAQACTTAVGDQRVCPLEDGSVVYLNTDSRVEVQYTRDQRKVLLVRGEALFSVARNHNRPFIVQSGDVGIRAAGTQFNVRRRDHATDVSVIEGGVQITPMKEPPVVRNTDPYTRTETAIPPTQIQAGEEVRVSGGKITRLPQRDVDISISWRRRQLVFSDTPLSDVAAEFNRYNLHQIRVEGDAAQQIPMSGTFYADQPQVLILYLNRFDNRDTPLSVQPRGDDWLIRAR
jgi:transmembrane sensor